MSKRKKIIIRIVIGLLVVVGIIGGKMYMAKQTHNQRVAEMANKLRYEGFETEIAKKLKEEFPDIKEIRFEGTSKNSKTGSYWSTFYIIADWTKGQPESEYYSDFTGYGSIQDIQTSGYSMGITKLMDKYDETGKTLNSVLVTYSTGKKKEI
ncbi:hypothetical protein [Pseudolactococcus reticulitermitis]|uniref:DUF1433 domain-containing protein n=1 Tax=Pseudolactococcus reticulitermitis TaxID=2025039 RepID=A0A224XDS2_9LACT|nr:hypothetical protein [Lactococcus reticulitermitis]GAX48254.1 hypothetical protein RsY01_1869 [Lactococcus reticulitermitis]